MPNLIRNLFLLSILLFLYIPLLGQSKPNTLEEGYRLIKVATILADSFQHQRSIDTLEKAKPIFEVHQNWDYYLMAYYIQGRNYYQLGFLDELELTLDTCGQIMSNNKTNQLLSIQHYFLEGQLLNAKGQYESAIDAFESAIQIWESNKNLKIIKYIPFIKEIVESYKGSYFGHIYNSEAFAILSLGDYDKAITYFKEARSEYKSSTVPSDTLFADINIATTFMFKGELEVSAQFCEQLLLSTPKNKSTIPHLTVIYNYLSLIYHLTKEYDREKIYLDKLEKMFSKPEIVGFMSFTGTSAQMAQFSVKARKIRYSSTLKKGLINTLETLRSLIDEIDRIEGERVSMAELYGLIGDVFLLENDPVAALRAFQKGLGFLTLENSKLAENENPPLKDIYFKIGALGLLERKSAALDLLASNEKSEKRIQYLKEGLETAELGVQCVEVIRRQVNRNAASKISKEGSLFDVEKKASQTFDWAISFAFQLYEEQNDPTFLGVLFKEMEQSKSYILRQSLLDLELSNGFSKSILDQIRTLETEVFYYEQRIAKAISEGDDLEVTTLRKDLFKVKGSFDKLLKSIQGDEVKEFDLLINENVATLKSTENIIGDSLKSAMVEYYESEKYIYVLLIIKGKSSVYKYNKTNKWNDWIKKINAYHLDIDLVVDSGKIDQYLILNDSLYSVLLKDVIKQLDKNIEQLIIIPHGSLYDINFGLLVTNSVKPEYITIPNLGYPIADFSKVKYLMKDFAISYSSSATLWSEGLKKIKDEQQNSFDLIAFSPTYKNRNALEKDNTLLSELPDEVKSALHLFDSTKVKYFQGEEVSTELFKRTLEEFTTNILHVSAHGKINDRSPLFSKIMFSNYKGEDIDLEVAELYNMKINARLAILSACQSGEGNVIGGSGRISLGRGFAYAGCPSMLVSMWEVDAQVNEVLVDNLYGQLILENNTIDQALRQAQLIFLAEQVEQLVQNKDLSINEKEEVLLSFHPYFWGSMIPVGVMNPIKSK